MLFHCFTEIPCRTVLQVRLRSHWFLDAFRHLFITLIIRAQRTGTGRNCYWTFTRRRSLNTGKYQIMFRCFEQSWAERLRSWHWEPFQSSRFGLRYSFRHCTIIINHVGVHYTVLSQQTWIQMFNRHLYLQSMTILLNTEVKLQRVKCELLEQMPPNTIFLKALGVLIGFFPTIEKAESSYPCRCLVNSHKIYSHSWDSAVWRMMRWRPNLLR